MEEGGEGEKDERGGYIIETRQKFGDVRCCSREDKKILHVKFVVQQTRAQNKNEDQARDASNVKETG